MASGILTAFLGALQASVSVLLVILYGALANHFKLLTEKSAGEISRFCVRICLPLLLVYNLGSQLHLDTATRYVPILIWAVIYNVLSVALGKLLERFFRLPDWATPAMTFNNTTSLPLLLVQSLEATGVLQGLLTGADDTTADAVERAKSYFLVNSLVSNSLTFALGPKLLNGQEEDAPDGQGEKRSRGNGGQDEESEDEGEGEGEVNGNTNGTSNRDIESRTTSEPNNSSHATESTSLLQSHAAAIHNTAHHAATKTSTNSPRWLQILARELYAFINAPMLGALLGILLGLVPALHRLFFASMANGGYLTAWLTSSIQNVGSLFTSLQVLVVGVKLYRSVVLSMRGEASGRVPWRAFLLITFVRFVLWPLVSVPVVWALVTRTGVLSRDPVLWFAMMLMPTGPPALKLTALAEVNGCGQEEKMAVSKFLTLSYIISPLITLAVVGSLKASEAAIRV